MKIINVVEWRHPEGKLGEVCVNYVTQAFFEELVSWKSKRLGKGLYSGSVQHWQEKQPLFIQRSEAKKLGWFVH